VVDRRRRRCARRSRRSGTAFVEDGQQKGSSPWKFPYFTTIAVPERLTSRRIARRSLAQPRNLVPQKSRTACPVLLGVGSLDGEVVV
jgi:hypothetical protein